MTTCDAPPDQDFLSTTYTTRHFTLITHTGDHDFDHVGWILPNQ